MHFAYFLIVRSLVILPPFEQRHRLDMCITVQTHFHIFLNNRKLEFDGFEPLTVWLSFLIDMDFRNQRFHNLSLLLLVHDSVQLFKINQHFVDIVSSEFFCFYCHFLCSGFNQQILRILYLIIHFIKAIIKVCFTLDVVLIIWVKGINLINQTGLRSIALTKLFFIIGNLLFNGGCIYMIAQYMDDTLARGYAAQNQMFATVGSLLLGQNQAPEAVQAARTANAMKIPAYQADQTTIQNTFMTVVKEIKKEAGSDLVAAKAISKEATEKMFAELTKGQDMQNPTITPEAVVDAITGSISGVDGVNQEALDNFNKALLGLMQTMVLPEDDGQDN